MSPRRRDPATTAEYAARESEASFQARVIALATACGWLVHHTRPARTAAGEWRTPVQGDAGFPDLVLVRPPRLLFVELKAAGRMPTAEQWRWLQALLRVATPIMASGRVDVAAFIWRPGDWNEIEEVLR